MTSMIPAAVTAALLLPGIAAAAETDTSPSNRLVRAEIGGHATVAAQMRAHRTETRLRRTNVRLTRAVARLEGERVRRGHRARIADLPADALRKRNRKLRGRVADLRRAAREAREQAVVATPPHLEAIAACESGGNPAAIGGGGLYRGKYQFSVATWQSVGGTGDPAAASEAEQDKRAAILYARAGSSPWPVCG
jgi:hypothetical protein